MMTAYPLDRHADRCGDLGLALALLIQWGREESEQAATQDAQGLADDAAQPETAEPQMPMDIIFSMN